MDAYHVTPANWQQELDKLSPQARAYVERLQADSDRLHSTFDFTFLEPGALTAMISTAFVNYLLTEEVRHRTLNGDEFRGDLMLLHRGLTDAVVYLENRKN